MLALTVLVATVAHRLKIGGEPQPSDEPPPSGMKGAVMFALLYVPCFSPSPMQKSILARPACSPWPRFGAHRHGCHHALDRQTLQRRTPRGQTAWRIICPAGSPMFFSRQYSSPPWGRAASSNRCSPGSRRCSRGARRSWRSGRADRRVPLLAVARRPGPPEIRAMSMETTLIFFKPDAIEKKLVGTVLARFEAAGFASAG